MEWCIRIEEGKLWWRGICRWRWEQGHEPAARTKSSLKRRTFLRFLQASQKTKTDTQDSQDYIVPRGPIDRCLLQNELMVFTTLTPGSLLAQHFTLDYIDYPILLIYMFAVILVKWSLVSILKKPRRSFLVKRSSALLLKWGQVALLLLTCLGESRVYGFSESEHLRWGGVESGKMAPVKTLAVQT